MDIQVTYKLENANYNKVQYLIEKVLMENGRYCRCQRCRMDTAALALNSLPSHYYVVPTHSASTELGSHWMLIEVAVQEALERVRANPHHVMEQTAQESQQIELPKKAGGSGM